MTSSDLVANGFKFLGIADSPTAAGTILPRQYTSRSPTMDAARYERGVRSPLAPTDVRVEEAPVVRERSRVVATILENCRTPCHQAKLMRLECKTLLTHTLRFVQRADVHDQQ